jgi:hypothetical protein
MLGLFWTFLASLPNFKVRWLSCKHDETSVKAPNVHAVLVSDVPTPLRVLAHNYKLPAAKMQQNETNWSFILPHIHMHEPAHANSRSDAYRTSGCHARGAVAV